MVASVAVGFGVGMGVAVGVDVAVGIKVEVAVGVGLGVCVGVGSLVGVAVGTIADVQPVKRARNIQTVQSLPVMGTSCERSLLTPRRLSPTHV